MLRHYQKAPAGPSRDCPSQCTLNTALQSKEIDMVGRVVAASAKGSTGADISHTAAGASTPADSSGGDMQALAEWIEGFLSCVPEVGEVEMVWLRRVIYRLVA